MTLTTVGYGDFYPTTMGRVVAVVVMLTGVGIIASLASILARVMIPNDDSDEDHHERGAVREQLEELRLELARLRQELSQGPRAHPDADE